MREGEVAAKSEIGGLCLHKNTLGASSLLDVDELTLRRVANRFIFGLYSALRDIDMRAQASNRGTNKLRWRQKRPK